MPPKENRVNIALFKQIMQKGDHFNGSVANFIYTQGVGLYKFSVVVPKKINKKANKRNKIKRILREIIKFEIKKRDINNLQFIVFIKQKPDFDKLDDFKNAFLSDLNIFLTKNKNIS